MSSPRRTIGLAINEITGFFQLPVYRKVRSEVFEADCNLLVIDGRILNSPNQGEKQQNVIYELVKNNRSAGTLVTASTLFHYDDMEVAKEFIARFSDKPVVALNEEIEEVPSVVVDNYSGISDLTRHLIEVHGCNRIAFVKGPENNQEAIYRFEAYQAVLSEFGKPLDPTLILEGDFRPEGGMRAGLKLVKGEIQCDAVMFANDDMALNAMRCIQTFKPDLLDRLAITGFDDIPTARKSVPQLTTAEQPIEEIAKTAVNHLFDLLKDKPVPMVTRQKSILKIRQTCGCYQVDSDFDFDVEIIQFLHKFYEHIQTFNLEAIYRDLSYTLELFTAKSVYILTFADGEEILSGDRFPEKAKFVYMYRDGEQRDVNHEPLVTTRDFLPDELYYTDSPSAYLIKPLCIGEKCLGYYVFETSDFYEGLYEALHLHLDLVFKAALLNGDHF